MSAVVKSQSDARKGTPRPSPAALNAAAASFAALTDRLVSIHTWSDPAKVGPYRETAWVWQDGRLFQQRERKNRPAHRAVANISALGEFVRTQL